MENIIIFLKINSSVPGTSEIIKHLAESKKNKIDKYYNLNASDAEKIKSINKNQTVLFVGIIFKKNDDDFSIEKAYLGKCTINKDKNSINYTIKKEISLNIALRNICKLAELNFDEDFGNSYLLRLDSELIAQQIEDIIQPSVSVEPKNVKYKQLKFEKNLHPLAQKNEYCRRYYNLRKESEYRSEYQRDYERLVHAKAFRRMVDKAQVYSASKGDYYRTRMTHSQIVAQIGRAIAGGLRLNIFLTEAIALGHDIGHTPFGHQGERTLDDIMRGKGYDIIKNRDILYSKSENTGFKHNYQSVRIATALEEQYPQIQGIDLSYQTLEGMLKHTRLKRDMFSLKNFVDWPQIEDDLHYSEDFCSTLEGQVVAIADEIAQRVHDLDDALASGAITYEDFKKYLELQKMKKLSDIINNVSCEIEESKNKHTDYGELRKSRVVSEILAYFIDDVIESSKVKIDGYDEDEFQNDRYTVKKILISFSKESKTLNNYLETIINNRVINNPEVSLFDSNAATIVSGLFKAYYNNPRLLHIGTKRRLYYDILKVSCNVVDFEYGNHEIIEEEFELMTKEDLENPTNENLKRMKDECIEEFNEYKEKRKILVRTICDYISGMTDTYALNEYNKMAKTF